MLYSEIIKTLNDIEENVSPEKIEYQEVKIWPLIRLELWKILHQGSQTSQPPKEPSLKKYYKKIKNAVLVYLEIFPYFFKKYPKADTVFMVSPLERNVRIDGKFYSRFGNSTEELVKEVGRSSLFLDLARKRLPVYGETRFIDREFAVFRKIEKVKKIFSLKKEGSIENWENLENYLASNLPMINLPKKNIEPLAELLVDYGKFFEKILKKIEPKACFFVCYYHSAGMGYARACRKLGIKTLEIQHGEQHGLYRGWANLPKDGYDTLPDIFWCWGEESAREINKWAKTTNHHEAIVVGNPWISRFLKKESTASEQENGGEKNILVAIPNKELSVIKNILDAFKNSPRNLMWRFRLHPSRIAGGQMEELEKELEKTGKRNFETKEASSAIIFEILSKMDFMITPWSTVAYEALAIGVHPIITSGDDKAIFENYANKGLFSFANTAEKILEVINKNKSEFNFKEEAPYIETDRKKMKKIVLDLIGKSG